MENELIIIRHGLFNLLENVHNPLAWAKFQRDLAKAIMQGEELKSNARDRDDRYLLSLHIKKCRFYGDALVWTQLNRHIIRQLYNSEARPPYLSNMSHVVENYLDMVDILANKNIFAFIPDLTNITNIADVVVLEDTEIPTLLELKGEMVYSILPKDHSALNKSSLIEKDKIRGRLQRQLGRMKDITDYLATGTSKSDSPLVGKLAISIDTEINHYWSQVEKAVTGAQNHKYQLISISDTHHIWAINNDNNCISTPPEILDNIPKGPSYTIGCHLNVLKNPSPHIMPPFNWDMSTECRYALMEGNVFVYHMIDFSALEGMSYENATIVKVTDDVKLGRKTIHIEVDGKIVKASSLNLYRIIYEFQNIESVAEILLQGAIKSLDGFEDFHLSFPGFDYETDNYKDE